LRTDLIIQTTNFRNLRSHKIKPQKALRTQDEHEEHQADFRIMTLNYSNSGPKITKINIKTPKTQIYNFVEGKKTRLQVEDTQNKLTTHICFSRVDSAHFSFEAKKYEKYTEIEGDSKT